MMTSTITDVLSLSTYGHSTGNTSSMPTPLPDFGEAVVPLPNLQTAMTQTI